MTQVRTGLGIDSHRFVEGDSDRPLVLGGLEFDDAPALAGNSDADVLLHALTDAISGVTGRTVIGSVADALCKQGITDSKVYLSEALKDLGSWAISRFHCIRGSASENGSESAGFTGIRGGATEIELNAVCITATTGEQLDGVGGAKVCGVLL